MADGELCPGLCCERGIDCSLDSVHPKRMFCVDVSLGVRLVSAEIRNQSSPAEPTMQLRRESQWSLRRFNE
jgi:hypothetical protein